MWLFGKTVEFYDDLYFNYYSRNDTSVRADIRVDNDKCYIDPTGIYANDGVTYLYLMESLEGEVLKKFKAKIRGLIDKGMRVNFVTDIEPSFIDWNSPHMKQRLAALAEGAQEERGQASSAYNFHKRIGTLRGRERIEESLYYLSEADRARNKSILSVGMSLWVTGVRGESFDKSISHLEKAFNSFGVNYVRVLYNIFDTAQSVSPFMLKDFGRKVIVPKIQITDEVLGSFSGLQQGVIGKDSVFVGLDIYSGQPVFMRPSASEEGASNTLITARTGRGKSQLIKAFVPQLLLDSRGTIMDIEGFEYLKLAKALKAGGMSVSVLNMAKGSGKYFDPVEIPKQVGREDIDSTLYDLSVSFTSSYLQAILQQYYSAYEDVQVIIDDTVSLMYRSAGVDALDRSTWGNSSKLSLFDTYTAMCELMKLTEDDSQKYRNDETFQKVLAKCIGRMATFFTPEGKNRSFFTDKMSIDDIMNAHLLICSFGLAGKTENMIDPFHVQLMQLSASIISFLRSLYSWLDGIKNFKIWEEFQRWGKFPNSDKTIGTSLTGGRKLGDRNFIITNQLGELLKDDRFSIMESLTSYFVGTITSSDTREAFCRVASIPQMLNELNKIANAKEDKEGSRTDPYLYSFLSSINGGDVTVVRMPIPKGLLKADIFQSGKEEDITAFE